MNGFYQSTDQLCTNGRLSDLSSEGNGKGAPFNAVTRLIPDLKFTCEGWITQFTVGGVLQPGMQDPKIQVWRENPDQCGAYHRPVADIPVNGSVCNGGVARESPGVFRCTLRAVFRVQVQPGDILGLELPPTRFDDFEIHFTDGGPKNYVFQNQLPSTTSTPLSGRANEIQEQPQISIIVETEFPTGTSN